MPDDTNYSGWLADAAATEAAGAALADSLRRLHRAGAVIWLDGDLGAGKTTLARGLLRALGVRGAVRSPTYTLLEPYPHDGGPLEGGGPVQSVLHMDLYRLQSPEELWELGLDGYPPQTTLWLVEWPQRGQGVLPPSDLTVALTPEADG